MRRQGLTAASSGLKRAILALLAIAPLAAVAAGHPPGSAVTSSAPAATQAGIDVLRAGGNAFDAAVAVSAALAVVRPDVAGLGGGGYWLLGQAPQRNQPQTETLIDGSVRAPEKGYAPPRKHGPAATAAIPGTAAALARLAKFGRLGLARDLQPAIRLASNGFTIDARLAERIAAAATHLSPTARAVFLSHGKAPPAGQTLRSRR
jgi:Gamma-glutamyltransferase